MYGQLITAFVLFIVFFALFIFIYFYTKGINAYRTATNKTIVKNTEEIIMNMKVVDGNLLPYHFAHGYDVQHKFGCNNTKDLVTGVSAKKNYCVVTERVIYICNNQMKYPFNIVEKYGKKFIELNDDIKTIETLYSFATPEHLLFKMEISKGNDGNYIVNVKKGDVAHDRDGNATSTGKI